MKKNLLSIVFAFSFMIILSSFAFAEGFGMMIPSSSKYKFKTNEIELKKGDTTTDTKSQIVIPEEDKKYVKEIKEVSKCDRSKISEGEDKYKIVFTDGSGRVVIVKVKINKVDYTINYINKNKKVVKSINGEAKVGSVIELKNIVENNFTYELKDVKSVTINDEGIYEVPVKVIMKAPSMGGSTPVKPVTPEKPKENLKITTKEINIEYGKDTETKNGIIIPEGLKKDIKEIKLIKKADRNKEGKGVDVYEVTFTNKKTQEISVPVVILKKEEKKENNKVTIETQTEDIQTTNDVKNEKESKVVVKKPRRLPNSGSLKAIQIFFFASILSFAIISLQKYIRYKY